MKNRIKRSKSEYVVFSVAFIILAAFGATYIFAYLWGVMAGCKTHPELILHPFEFPEKWMWRNYIDAFQMLEVNDVNMIGMIGNSLWLVFFGALFNVMGGCLMAYATTKYRFVGRTALVTINIITMIIPIMGALPSQYRTYHALGMLNSPLILIAYFGGFGSINLYMTAFFKNLSWEYAEAALMDGANHYTILFRIMLPLAQGPIVALYIMQAVSIWNDYMTALLFLDDMPTLATGIYLFQATTTYRARLDILFAAVVLSSIPVLVLYSVFSKTILTNVSMGGLKA